MKRTVSVEMTALAFLLSASIAAQTPSAPQQPSAGAPEQRTGGPQRDSAAAERITVNGCVERADQILAGSTVDSMTFVLTNAARGAAKPVPSGSGAVGTAGSAASPGASTAPPGSASAASPATPGTTYRLDAETAKLNPHVGHRVEIAGTLMPARNLSTDPSPRPDSPNTSAADAGGRPSPASTPALKVESLTMISQTCGR